MTESHSIRQASAADYSSIATLTNLCFEDEVLSGTMAEDTYQSIEQLKARGCILFVLILLDTIIGFAFLDPERKAISKLAVHPAQRNFGYGRQLMEFAEANAKRRGWRKLFLGVSESKSSLVNYYSNLGYTPTGDKFEMMAHIGAPPDLPLLIIMSKKLTK